jgi:excisionase family DNA binding protein
MNVRSRPARRVVCRARFSALVCRSRAPSDGRERGQARTRAAVRDTSLRCPCGHGGRGRPSRSSHAGALVHERAPLRRQRPRRPPDVGVQGGEGSSSRLRHVGMSARTGGRTTSELLSTRQAAKMLGVHERTVRRYASTGALAHQRLPGGHYRIAKEAIEDLLARSTASHPSRRPVRTSAEPAATRLPRPPASRGRRHPRPDGAASVRYDLAAATLAALRARTEPRRG